MRPEGCREWRESLGAYALGQLAGDERAGLEAHLDGCPDCRAELGELQSVARVMPLADPERFAEPETPPRALGERIAATIARERRSAKRGRRLRIGVALGGATAAAAAAAVLAIFVLSGGSGPGAEQRVSFSSLPPGMKIAAVLEPRAYGTEIQMYVEGVPSGTLCRVLLRGPNGVRLSAGTFRYRYGAEEAVLGSALDLSSTRAIVVHVGSRVFSAPVASGGAA
jgi:anti-sigma factor RsiW